MPQLIAIVCTHTTRHLHRVLLGVASQRRRADRVIVTCDGDSPDLRNAAAGAADSLGLPLTLVQRVHAGVARSGQVRNNAARALLSDGVAGDSLLVFLDGDICPDAGCFAAHERLAAAHPVVLGFRFDLTPAQTDGFDDAALREGRPPVPLTPEQQSGVAARQKRYQRQLLLRWFGFGKKHKPKLLSANFAVRLSALAHVNGFDELYEGYGQEDDDLGRRLFSAGYKPALGLRDASAYHLWHETRAPGDWENSPNAARFLRGGPARCVQGIANPKPQGAIRRSEHGQPRGTAPMTAVS